MFSAPFSRPLGRGGTRRRLRRRSPGRKRPGNSVSPDPPGDARVVPSRLGSGGGFGDDTGVDAEQVEVVIAGGGPAGLTLAIELGRRGVSCLLLDDKPATTTNPQAHATQARTM